MNDSLDSEIRALLARLEDQVPLPPPFETLRERPVAPSPNRKAVFVASGGLVAAATVGVAVLTSYESSKPASNVAPLATTTTAVASPPTDVPPKERSYRVVGAQLSVSASRGTLDVGSEHGVRAGVGVYQGGLIGVVEETRATSSTVRLLGSPDLEVRAAVPYPDAGAEDGSQVSTVEGTVRTVRDQVVFTPDEPRSDDGRIHGRYVVVAGGPGILLQGKTPIGSISQSVFIDGSTSYLLQLSGTQSDGDVTILLPK